MGYREGLAEANAFAGFRERLADAADEVAIRREVAPGKDGLELADDGVDVADERGDLIRYCRCHRAGWDVIGTR